MGTQTQYRSCQAVGAARAQWELLRGLPESPSVAVGRDNPSVQYCTMDDHRITSSGAGLLDRSAHVGTGVSRQAGRGE
jgi:hypothetical protein